MAFYTSGLPNMAAVTSDLWPSMLNTLMVPWRGTISPQPKPQISKHRPARLAQDPANAAKESTKRVELPDFFNDMALSRSPTTAHPPTDLHAIISNMSPRSLAAANPLFQRSYRALLPRNIGHSPWSRPALSFQPVQMANPFARMQSARSFGTGGISRSLLANREAAANRNPSSATAQNAFYQALLKANMPAIVIERYQSNRFATNEAGDEAYRKALSMMGVGSTTVANGGPLGVANDSGLTPSQIQAVSQAVAAHTHGGAVAVARGGTGTKDGPIRVVVDESLGGVVFRWLKFILWFCLFTYISLVVLTMMIEGLNTIRRPGGKVDSEAKAEDQTVRFSDVHGADEAVEEVQELVEFLKNPEKFATLGGKLPKGILLVGPPGTGKTLLARAVAGEAGVPFFYMSGSEFDEVYVGVGAKRVRDLFAAAKGKAPSIIFIDELDAIGGRRNARDAAYVKQTLNQLLTELDGFEQNNGVIIIGATNFPELLDKALTRPGRFDRHVVVGLPDVRGRVAILKYHSQKIKAASDVNLEAIARGTSGLSGAELENIVNSAAIRASKNKATSVTQSDFDWAKDKIIMGAERRTMVITPKEKEMTAYHEAGHALISFLHTQTGYGYNFYKVTVLPRGQTLGHASTLPEMDKYSYNVKDYRAQLEVMMGGKLAEEIRYGSELTTSGVSSDLANATNLAFAMVTEFGMSDKLGAMEYHKRYNDLSSETRAVVEAEVKRTLDEAYTSARNLLMSKRKELDLLAKALVKYETLDRAEVEKVIRGEDLPNRMVIPLGPMVVPKPPDKLSPSGILDPLPGGQGGEGQSPPPPAPPGVAP